MKNNNDNNNKVNRKIKQINKVKSFKNMCHDQSTCHSHQLQ